MNPIELLVGGIVLAVVVGIVFLAFRFQMRMTRKFTEPLERIGKALEGLVEILGRKE